MMDWLLVVIGAAVGAPLRYLADRWISTFHDGAFPWGTLAVNVAGCGLLGAVTGLALPGDLVLLVGVGLCGALTTYSTFALDTVRLAEHRARGIAGINVVANTAGGLLAFVIAASAAGML
ncbi:fluoride efflux transporter FluC [Lolliginicoccus suaedae]|uniref:fluoride efflux transporter FluC n=1 Tax=Lolliginicoccus suaedae TaxID=2605429 RepID=UPI001F2D215D|nr:CrcB family protein [Lolliginicoccus suaedae]